MLTFFFVASRIVANPLSNVFQKKLGMSADARSIILVTHLLLTLVCLPILLVIRPAGLGAAFWGNMALCAVLAVAGNTLIVAALQSADLSVLGPLNAYKSVVGLVLGMFLLGEYPSLLGIAGVVMILGGSALILDQPGAAGVAADRRSDSRDGQPLASQQSTFVARIVATAKNKGIQLRFVALVFSAAEAVFLKKALLLSSPAITFVFWCILGLPLAAVVVAYGLRSSLGQEAKGLRGGAASCILLAGTTGLMQFSTLYTFDVMQVGYSLALFQTSTLLSVLFGYQFFQEQNIARRLIGALVMIAGAAVIISNQ